MRDKEWVKTLKESNIETPRSVKEDMGGNEEMPLSWAEVLLYGYSEYIIDTLDFSSPL